MLHKFFLLFGVIFIVVILWQKLFYWVVNLIKPLSSFSHNYPKAPLFLANLLVGIIVWFALSAIKDYPLVIDAEDANLDFAMEVRQDEIPPAKAKQIPSFVFLDIDNQTHKVWGEPLFTPRNKVKELIDVAVQGGARLVIVDIDLSQQTPVAGLNPSFYQTNNKSQLHPYDQELYDYIASYQTRCQNTSCPPIILARVFRPPQEFDDDEQSIADWFRPEPQPVFESRTGFLENAAAQAAPYVQWASPLFLASTYDNVIRRWSLWQPICTDKQPQVIPSIQLLTAALIRHETPQQAQDNLDKALDRFKPQFCSDTYVPQPASSEPIKIAEGLEITEGTYGIRQRIMYNMPWRSPVNISEKFTVRYFLSDHDRETKERKVILTVYSAQSYLDSSQSASAGGALKDKIVMIGGSYTDGGDMHATPLGDMPGGLIALNAIHSLLQYGEIKPLSYWENFGWTVLSLFVMGLIFLLIGDSLWWVMVTATITIVSVPVSVFFLGDGIWINFAFPLLAVHIHQISGNSRLIAEQLERLQQQELRDKIDKQELATEIEHSLKQSLNEQIHTVIMTKFGLLDQSERTVTQLTAIKPRSHFTPTNRSKEPSYEPDAKKASLENSSEEVSEAQANESSAMPNLTGLDNIQPYQKKTTESEDVVSELPGSKTSQDDLTMEQNVSSQETTTQEEVTKPQENKT